MNLQVLLFATFADIAGSRKVLLEIDEPYTVASLVRALQKKFPALRGYDTQSILVAVNQEMAGLDRQISSSDEVGVFPPVSGG